MVKKIETSLYIDYIFPCLVDVFKVYLRLGSGF